MLAVNVPIREIRYEPERTRLTIRFETASHVYVGVPPEAHRGLCESESPLDYLGREIQGAYPYNVVAA